MDDDVEVSLKINGTPCRLRFSRNVFDLEPEVLVRIIATEALGLINDLVKS